MNCAALKEMNLTLATTIGEEAFKGCTTLYGVADAAEDGKKIMYVGATDVYKRQIHHMHPYYIF